MSVELSEVEKNTRDTTRANATTSVEIIRSRRQLMGLVVLVMIAVFGLPLIINTELQAINDDVIVEVVRSKSEANTLGAVSDPAAQDVQLDDAVPPVMPNARIEPAPKPAVQIKPTIATLVKPAFNDAPKKASNPNVTKPPVDRYFVQLGVFESLTKANTLRDAAKKNGANAEVKTLSIAGKTQHSVRILGFESRTSAETVRGQLKKAGISSILIKN